MKNPFVYLAAICSLILGTMQVSAQSFNHNKNNYLVLTKNTQQLKSILLTAEDLAKEDGKKYGEFQIIICGKTVIDFTDSSSLKEILANTKAQNVKINACGISLKKFNIDPILLPPSITVVENGILYSFQLKKKGFITLSI